MQHPQNNPTLAGAHRGKVRPWRVVEGGIWLDTEKEGLVNRECALRIVKETAVYRCIDYARQYLVSRGDKEYSQGQLNAWTNFFLFHHALIEVPSEGIDKLPLLFGDAQLPPSLADSSGKLSIPIVATLPLNDLAEGQMGRLTKEYAILRETETPDGSLSHKQWSAIVAEGKDDALKTLVSRHGSSALIQVLHGMGSVYPE